MGFFDFVRRDKRSKNREQAPQEGTSTQENSATDSSNAESDLVSAPEGKSLLQHTEEMKASDSEVSDESLDISKNDEVSGVAGVATTEGTVSGASQQQNKDESHEELDESKGLDDQTPDSVDSSDAAVEATLDSNVDSDVNSEDQNVASETHEEKTSDLNKPESIDEHPFIKRRYPGKSGIFIPRNTIKPLDGNNQEAADGTNTSSESSYQEEVLFNAKRADEALDVTLQETSDVSDAATSENRVADSKNNGAASGSSDQENTAESKAASQSDTSADASADEQQGDSDASDNSHASSDNEESGSSSNDGDVSVASEITEVIAPVETIEATTEDDIDISQENTAVISTKDAVAAIKTSHGVEDDELPNEQDSGLAGSSDDSADFDATVSLGSKSSLEDSFTETAEEVEDTKKSKKDKKAKAPKHATPKHGAANDAKNSKDAADAYLATMPTADKAANNVFPELPQKKRHRALKTLGIAAAVVVIAVGITYGAGTIYFMTRFLPGTAIANQDVSMMNDTEVITLLNEVAENYEIEVSNDSFSKRATSDELGLEINPFAIVQSMHENQESWRWPVLIFQNSHDLNDALVVDFHKTDFNSILKGAIDTYNETALPPVNATIAYDNATSQFIVKKEEVGTQLDTSRVLEKITDAVLALDSTVALTEDELLQPAIFSTDEKLVESAKLATGMTSAHLTLMLAGNPVREITGADLSPFISIDENLDVALKDEDLNNWCNGLAEEFNTIGKTRTYTRADGKVISVSGGSYGWEIDTEALRDNLINGIKGGVVAQVDIPLLTEADLYVGNEQRDWGNRYIDVDIAEQHVRFYDESGNLFWETDCISGMPDGKHDTGLGVWVVNGKSSPSTLKGYENGKKIYETKVTYWMPFEGNEIGFHDATWQPRFGGTMYADGYGSHGCVNLSYEAAKQLYDIIREGDVVVVHY